MAVKYGLVIDLGRCVGCGTCAIACKTENNTRHEDLVNGRKYNWADYYTAVKGTFPNTEFEVVPVLCNHCGERTVNDPPCVQVCPVTPDVNGNKAIWKTAEGITMRDDVRCNGGILAGCGQICMSACPYSAPNVNTAGVQWSVNHFNPAGTSSHPYWEDTTEVIAGGTSSPAAVAAAAGTAPAPMHEYTHQYYNDVRIPETVEKCYFCDHRLQSGEEPYCVVSCPAGARIFGDQNDPFSEIAQLIASNQVLTLADNQVNANGELNWQLPEQGTSPNVYYIGQNILPVGTETAAPKITKLNIYPNPAIDNATLEFELDKSTEGTILFTDMSGRVVESLTNKHFAAGKQSVRIDVSKLSNGRYICSLKTKDGTMKATSIVIAK